MSLLYASAKVQDTELKDWRKLQKRPYRSDGSVAGGLFHLLTENTTSSLWRNIAAPETRAGMLFEIEQDIREIVLPYFAKFQNAQTLITQLATKDLPAFSIGDQVEYALCFSGSNAAQKIIDRFLNERMDLLPAVHEAYTKMKKDGPPPFFS
ncbi:hypothetical protein [Leptospira alexanderi]|uniref:Uncharacterized protein n=1 Tax=Leptospira alexanderi serovar Manhao 3 str. L 60 TaxID=1049759 RepID=V6IDZ9_9LEPT|nr:hypothetical protein [Leptospira alexanderi]EQA62573.1 hypothetical protein LEP1GSC062_3344 [Leptospira alexanderi serovar Manhao 3 str. L 60]